MFNISKFRNLNEKLRNHLKMLADKLEKFIDKTLAKNAKM